MIPAAIQALLPQHPGEENRIGHSGAQVVMYEDCVLKVQPDTGNAANEGIMLRFLKGRLPVPEVLAEAVQGGMRYLRMTRLQKRTSPLGASPLTPRISRKHTAQADLHRRKRCWRG